MLLTAASKNDAAELIKKLNNTTIHSLIVNYTNEYNLYQKQTEFLTKKQLKSNKKLIKLDYKTNLLADLDITKQYKEKLYVRTANEITIVEQQKRKCRLIIRNLSFLATEQNLLDKMSKFGPIVSVELPKKIYENTKTEDLSKKTHSRHGKEDKEPKEKSMGFGFVTYLCESDAKIAVESSSSLKVCNREVAVDFCMSKDSYEKHGKKQEEEGGDELAAVVADMAATADAAADTTTAVEEGDEVEGSEVEEGSDEEEEEVEGSEIDEEEELEGSDEEEEEVEGSEIDEEEELEGSDEEDADMEEDSEDEVEGSDDASTASEEEEGSDIEEAEQPEKKKKEPSDDVHEGCTVFIRGLSFDTETSDIKQVLGKYGRIALAIIVKDKITDMSKGTAFVKYHSPDCANDCISAALLSNGLMIKDRLCKIDLAVDRQSAQNIKDIEIAKRGKDKRNLYLANEGLILPGQENNTNNTDNNTTNKVIIMSEADKEKRQRAQTEKNKKLQNPLFFVSATRLSIRNLSKTINDKELRELCITAAKNGIKKGLVKRSDMVSYRLAQGSDNIIEELKKQKLYKANMDLDTVPPSVGKHSLKNAKIMLDLQRIRGGAPQSRGYAFCEFIHHAHALACLRELNNNAAYSTHHSNTTSGGLGVGENIGGKLIVEMSLENFQKVSRCGFIAI